VQQALRDAGYTVTVCSPTGPGSEAVEEDVEGVLALRYPLPAPGAGITSYVREYALSVARQRRLMREAHRRRPVDAVIVASPPDLMVLPALALRRRGAAVILDHHDLSPELFELKFGRRGPVYRALLANERWAMRRADAVISTTESYAQIARGRGGIAPDRVFVVRNGPDPKRIFPVDPRPELRHGHERMLLWIGMVESHDGLELLIDAAESLHRRRGRTDVGIVIGGPGGAREELQALARSRGLDDVVHFPGQLGDELLRGYISTADVCLSVDQPNPQNDASGVVKVFEYMLAGRPIVQFPLRETQAQSGDTTLYAEPGDVEDLVDRVVELLDDPERGKQLGAAARAVASERLTWPQQIPRLLEAVDAAIRLRHA
jgi:glycosyltransferase involved in cell wall biosynthesis